MYTVKDLITILKSIENKDRVIILSRDEEGNGFAPLAELWASAYKDGDVGIEELTQKLEEQGYSEEDVIKNGQPCVVFWP